MNGVIQKVNPAFTKVTGYKAEEAIGKTPSILQSGKHEKDFYRSMWEKINSDGYWQGEIWNRKKNGEIYPEWLTISTIRDDAGQPKMLVAMFSDLSNH
ncbi:PAS domain S-box protein [Mesobacillus subterraneus]|nr:PAS domain S-box protein [Mesobacillus subterraneus]MCM3574218.1 PAS domain S-box protein [Mesobacillus subterraneus]